MNDLPAIPLIIEGLTDAAFFQQLLLRLFLSDGEKTVGNRLGRENVARGVKGVSADGRIIDINFLILDGKHGPQEVVTTLLNTGVVSFTVAQDIDRGTVDETVDSIRDMVRSISGHTGSSEHLDQQSEVEPDVRVIPMGLPDDESLRALGVVKHEMEDYLVALALQDEVLRENVPELRQALDAMLPIVREKDGAFDSGKEIFQIIKPLVQLGFSDTGLAESFITKADPDVLKSVLAPLIEDMERALGMQQIT